MYFPLGNGGWQDLCHTPETHARLLLKVVCLVTDFSKKYLAAWQSVFSGILVLAHYVHGRWKQVWRRTRKLSEYFLKCIVRFLASHVELFLRKKKKVAWMGKKKSVYSICKSVLPVSISCSYHIRLDFSVARGHVQSPESHAVSTLVWSASSSLPEQTLCPCILLRISSSHMLPWINSAIFLLKNQSQFDLGTCPFPNEIETQSSLSMAFVHIPLCIPFKTII